MKTMKTLVLLAVLVVCSAQPPPPPCKNAEPPKIAETFESETMVHRRDHNEPEVHGVGEWNRNMEMGQAMEKAKFTMGTRTAEEERLWLFDKHMEYFIFMNSTGSHCRSHQMSEDEKIPEVWDWLEHAHCSQRHDPRNNKTYDAWEGHVQDLSITLYVDDAMPNEPLGLIRRDRRGEEDVRFSKFTATTPPESAFAVPTSCSNRRH